MKSIFIFSITLILFSCGTKTIVFEDGIKGEGRHRNNQKEGKWVFTKDGKLNSIGKYSNGKQTGKWIHFYANGKIHQKGNFQNDKQNGIWKFYYETGSFMGVGQITNDKQNGLWNWYYKNGRLYTERIHEDGKLIEIKSCFDKNGNLLDCGKLINGNGYLLYHDIDNESDTIQKFEYENGIFKK
ncbi:toxin-antitoxin system YwqK family antitoxin [Flavobacterium sp. W1B]|uniref:toxin-antitoxin system YwqK family antitoxin n=1 Tax=Flavobacterium sp. W1B TaxID=3394146 RepID=UPI0039BCA39F